MIAVLKDEVPGNSGLLDVSVENNYAYGYYNGDLNVIDLWDPEHPRFYGRYHNEQESYLSLAVSEGYAYLGANNRDDETSGLRVVDVRNSARPVGVAFLPLYHEIRKVAVDQRYAYLYGYRGSEDSVFYVVDIADPSHPRVIGKVALPSTYITSSLTEMVVHKDHVLLMTGIIRPGLTVVDVRDPAAPGVVREFDQNLRGNHGAVSGDWAFVTDGFYNRAVKVIDIEDPSLPTLRLTYSFPNVGSTHSVDGSGDRLYTSSRSWDSSDSWLRVFDIADPRTPRLLGELEEPWRLGEAVVTDRGRVFVPSDQGLLAIDTSDPAQPHIAGVITTYGSLSQVAVREPYGYVADGPAGLTVLDLAHPERMDVLASVPLPYEAENVAVDGNHAYVISVPRCPGSRTCGNERLVTAVDVSNPRRPKIVSQMPIANIAQPSFHQLIASIEGYLYIIDRRFQILDVRDPRRMRVVSDTWGYDRPPTSASIDEPFLFISGIGGLDIPACCFEMHNISNPILPQYVFGTGTYGSAVDLWSRDGQLAFADGRQGLTMFRLNTPAPSGGLTATPTAPVTPPADATATATVGIRVLPATPEFTPYPFPTPRPMTPTPTHREVIYLPLAERSATD